MLAELRRETAAEKAAEAARTLAERETRARERAERADAEHQRRLALDAMEAGVRAEARSVALEVRAS